ncbi:ATP-binding protein [Crocinitomix algicola]|uniref:ATP-binding protein n=1 Tax=Crocinitomix algicola TaxID=1740263 RepID=UPI0008724C24|nr:AAA family ATPase [Crocinitomix algicola]
MAIMQPNLHTISIKDVLYGRETELDLLNLYHQNSMDGEKIIVLIKGNSGVGKSSLANKFGLDRSKEGDLFVTSKLEISRDNPPYNALIEVFRSVVNEWYHLLKSGNNKLKATIEEELGVNLDYFCQVFPRIKHMFDLKEMASQTTEEVIFRGRLNEMLLSLTRVINRYDQPVIALLDDIQWTDKGTVEFFRCWLSEGSNENLFWICTFRSEDDDRVVWALIEEVLLPYYKSNIRLLLLRGLKLVDIHKLINRHLKIKHDDVSELIQLIDNVTGGNPLYVNIFIQELCAKQILAREEEREGFRWTYHPQRYKDLNRSMNMLEVIIRRIEFLPQETIKLLGVGAAIGSSFHISLISGVSEKPIETVKEILMPAVNKGIIEVINNQNNSNAPIKFRFTHDKFQNVTYSLLSEDRKKWIHQAIGRTFSASLGYAAEDRNIFDIVNHYNHCYNYFNAIDERKKMVEMNCNAAEKAIKLCSYDHAVAYYNKAIQIIDSHKEEWEDDKIYPIYLSAGRAAFLNKDFVSAVMFYESALKFAHSNLEKAYVYYQFIIMYNDVDDTESVFDSASKALKLLNYPFNFNVSKFQLFLLFWKINRKTKKITPNSLVNFVKNDSQEENLIGQILFELWVPSWSVNLKSLTYLNLKCLELTLQKGLSNGSYFGIVGYGVFSGYYSGKIKKGWEWVQAGYKVAEETDFPIVLGKALAAGSTVYGHAIHGYKKNITVLERSYRLSKSTGDYITAAYVSLVMIENYLLAGVNLDEVCQIAQNKQSFLKRTENKTYVTLNKIMMVIPKTLTDSNYVWTSEIERLSKKNDYIFTLHLKVRWYVVQLFLGVLFKNVDVINRVLKHPLVFYNNDMTPIQYLRILTVSCLLVRDKNRFKFKKSLKILAEFKKRLTPLLEVNNKDYFHLERFLSAAELELKGKLNQAIKIYEIAIEEAEKVNAWPFLGMYAEEIIRISEGIENRNLGKIYFKKAILGFANWGATVKVVMLEDQFQNWLKKEERKM